jgi:hypothetical protein
MRLIYENDLMDKNFVTWLKKLITISEPQARKRPSQATKLGLAWDMRMSESANAAGMSAAGGS